MWSWETRGGGDRWKKRRNKQGRGADGTGGGGEGNVKMEREARG